MPHETYDTIIIGAGQAGVPLASALAEAGRKTALIEREHIGGTCINEGCTPTKTMVASARVAYFARRSSDYGVHVGDVAISMERIRQRKREMVDSFRDSSQKRLESTEHLDVIFGEASFTGPKELRVSLANGEERMITSETIVINTGCRPSVPKIGGIDTVPYLNSTTIMELDSVPEHLLILGGGYIGLEFGQMFRRFGSRVTIIQHDASLLPHEDDDIVEEITKILREDGIEIWLDANATTVTHSASGEVTLTLQTASGEQTVTGSHLLAATGRTPNTEKLGLTTTGITVTDHGTIPVNFGLETIVPGVFAVGDVNGGPNFTHISYDDYRVLKKRLLDGQPATTEGRMLPYTMFTDPQLGRVGLSEKDARKQGKAIKIAKMPMSSVARALETDEPRGIMKAVVDPETDQILGCAILGIEGGEMMAVIEMAMLSKLPYTTLRDGIFAHPTLAEAFNNLFASFE